jgi:hypothetical protein
VTNAASVPTPVTNEKHGEDLAGVRGEHEDGERPPFRIAHHTHQSAQQSPELEK